MDQTNNRIVIIGGGFGGVYTARYLLAAGRLVTLVSDKNYFTFTPLLHEVATGNLLPTDISFEYTSFFNHPRFLFVRGTATTVDYEEKKIVLHSGQEIEYDYAVIAVGSRTAKYDIVGVSHAITLKTLTDAVALKRRIVSVCQSSNDDINITVVGAGPTGVELILEIAQFVATIQHYQSRSHVKLRLIGSSKEILAGFDPAVRRYADQVLKHAEVEIVLDAKVTEISPQAIYTKTTTYSSDITVLVAGVQPQPSGLPDDRLDQHAHVNVNQFLQVVGHEREFALGDVIAATDGPLPKLAQLATVQARVVADNILRLQEGHALRPYVMSMKGMLLSLGRFKGVGTIFGLTIRGVPAWFVWRTVYLFKTPGILNKLRVAFTWTLNLFTKRNLVE